MRFRLAALLSLLATSALAQNQGTPTFRTLGVTNGGSLSGTYSGSPTFTAPTISGGTISGADISSASATAAGGSASRTLSNREADAVNVLDYGAKCDGTTDDTSAFQSAIAASKPVVVVPANPTACKITGTLSPTSGQTITGLGGRPTIALVSGSVGRLFDLTSQSNVTIRDLILDGTSAPSNTADFIRFFNTTNSRLLGTTITHAPGISTTGCVLLAQTSTDNEIAGNTITNCGSTSIVGNNAGVQRNKIHDNTISNGGAFGIRMMFGASRNEISGNVITSTTLESVAVSLGSQYNRIENNHLELAGDNCISIVGDHNVITGNFGKSCWSAGTYLWGSYNTVSGNTYLDNSQSGGGVSCISIGIAYGAAAQYNDVVGNTCDDDQASPTQSGIAISSAVPTVWSASLSVTSGQFVTYGLNSYVAGSTGTTGATPPTCTSGTCSDGTITWTYQSSFVKQVGALFNVISGNNVNRWAGGTPYTGLPSSDPDMVRNGSFTVSQPSYNTALAVGFNGIPVDGWRYLDSNGSQFQFQRVASSAPNSPYAELATAQTNFSLVAASQFTLVDRIEGIRLSTLGWGTSSAQPVVLEACAMLHGLTGPVAVALDNASNFSYVTSVNVTTADTWQCFSQVIPGPTTGTWNAAPGSIGARLSFSMGLGSNFTTSTTGAWQSGLFYGPTGMAQVVSTSGASLRLTGVHLYRAGSVLPRPNFEQELRDAQRWYYSTFPTATVVGQNQGLTGALCTVNAVAGGKPSLFVSPPVKMFGAAGNTVITTYNPSAANANWRDVTAGTDVGVTVDPATAIGANGVLLTTSTTVANQGDVLCIHATIDAGL